MAYKNVKYHDNFQKSKYFILMVILPDIWMNVWYQSTSVVLQKILNLVHFDKLILNPLKSDGLV